MVCSEFAVLEKNYTQELYTQENKEIFVNLFTGFIPSIYFKTPLVQEHSGPEKISRKHIYTEDKIFWSHWYPSSGKHIYKLQIKSTRQAVEQPQTLTV